MIERLRRTLFLTALLCFVSQAFAGRLQYLLESDANADYFARHHRPQPRIAFMDPKQSSNAVDAASEVLTRRPTVVAGPTTPSQRRRGWVWVQDGEDDVVATNTAKSKTAVPTENLAHKK